LGHAEDLVVASIVNLYMAAVLDRQSSCAWENSIPKIILRPRPHSAIPDGSATKSLTPASGLDS
jgi:hypothetical protein